MVKIPDSLVLTRDMCPIHYFSEDLKSYAHFVCPVPLGFQDIINKNSVVLWEQVKNIVDSVNKKAREMSSPFQNILIEYGDRKTNDKLDLLKNFQILDISFNERRGLYALAIHGAYGDIYLDTNTRQNCDLCVEPFQKFFEPNAAFHCHNVDYYWQALLTREVVVDYFNMLKSLESKR